MGPVSVCVECIGSVRNSVIMSGDTDHSVLIPEDGFEVRNNLLDDELAGNTQGAWKPNFYYEHPEEFDYHLKDYDFIQFGGVAQHEHGDPRMDRDGDPIVGETLVGHDQAPAE